MFRNTHPPVNSLRNLNVSFPQSEGPIKLTELQRISAPLNQADYQRIKNMKEFIGVVLIGARIQHEAMVTSLQCQEFPVLVEVVSTTRHHTSIC